MGKIAQSPGDEVVNCLGNNKHELYAPITWYCEVHLFSNFVVSMI